MPRDALAQARIERNAALLETMVLAASADGQISPRELEVVLSRIIERPEFEGVEAQQLSSMLENAAQRLSAAKSLDDVLAHLKQRLPDHRNRLLAFGLATSVVLADRRATRAELGLLKSFQAALAVSEDEVSLVFETIQAGRSLAEALGEPVEQLYAETMVLVSAADGEVTHGELESMLENLAGDPLFKDVSLEHAQKYLRDAVLNLSHHGMPSRLTTLAHGLSTHAQRSSAFKLALRVAWGNGEEPSKDELRVLELLQATFGLSDDDAKRLAVRA